ncbi:MAG: hypothetical protein OXG37_00525 [Actinomycetia bacterium]|nr:hypothetical protein [Actinomycetes bacterium]
MCYSDDFQEGPSGIPHRAHLTAVDTDGVYLSSELTGCGDGPRFSLHTLAAQGAQGEKGTPVEVARRVFQRSGIRAGDIVDRAGNPDALPTLVRMVRDGKAVLVAGLTELSDGGWLVDSLTGCAGFPPETGELPMETRNRSMLLAATLALRPGWSWRQPSQEGTPLKGPVGWPLIAARHSCGCGALTHHIVGLRDKRQGRTSRFPALAAHQRGSLEDPSQGDRFKRPGVSSDA